MLSRRIAVVAAATIAVQLVPLAAHADGPIPIDVLTVATQAASTCNLSSHYLVDSPLRATAVLKADGETDFVWHASAQGHVSSTDSCVTGIMISTQLTDSTQVPNCPPMVQSPAGDTVSTDPYTYQGSGNVDYEVDNNLDFSVPYFDAPGTLSSTEGAVTDNGETYPASAPDVAPVALSCERVRSTVTEDDTLYYANSQHQFIPYCSQQVTYDYVSTPAGPQQVGDPIVDSLTC